jgi:hypothetical protein
MSRHIFSAWFENHQIPPSEMADSRTTATEVSPPNQHASTSAPDRPNQPCPPGLAKVNIDKSDTLTYQSRYTSDPALLRKKNRDNCTILVHDPKAVILGWDLVDRVMSILDEEPKVQQFWGQNFKVSEFHLARSDYTKLLKILSPANTLTIRGVELNVQHFEDDRRTYLIRKVPAYLTQAEVIAILEDAHGPKSRIVDIRRARRNVFLSRGAKFSVPQPDCWYVVQNASHFPQRVEIDKKTCEIFQQG